MIAIDINVLSEFMRLRPAEPVKAFFKTTPITALYLPSIVLAELRYGVELLPASRRRVELERSIDGFEYEGFAGRILPFDAAAAGVYSVIMAGRIRRGRPIGSMDAQIAAIARADRMRLATRDIRDFADTGIDLVDPFAV